MPEIPEGGPEWEALSDYVSGGFTYLNESLRTGQPAKRGAANIPLIQKAIESAPTLDSPVTTYRGVRFNSPAEQAAFVQKLTAAASSGSLLEDPGFSSTSINPAVGQRFAKGNLLFEISARQGLYLGESVGGKNEAEYLLKAGSRFRVLGVEDRNGQQVARLEQVP